MATEIIMPKAGMAMEEGLITRWLKDVGDRVESGEAVVEIETDKTAMEVEVYTDGVLLAKLYDEGAVVPVTVVVGYIGEPGEKIPDAPAVDVARAPVPDAGSAEGIAENTNTTTLTDSKKVPATPFAKTIAIQKGIDIATVTGSGASGVIKARDVERAYGAVKACGAVKAHGVEKAVKSTPLAKRIAEDRDIDLSTVSGTGYAGKVTSSDVLTAAPGVADANYGTLSSPNAIENIAPLSGMRAVIGRRMLQSHLEIPPVTQNMKTYVDELISIRAKINENREQKITINDFIIKACAKAVSEFPQIRTQIDIDAKKLITQSRVNIGVAVALERGLIVPVIFDADKMQLSEISARMKDLSARAKSGKLRTDEYNNSTFTISNMGSLGIHDFTPIINQPNAIILGIGCINDELALINGEVIQKKYMMLSLTFDHRIIDGAQSAIFQSRIKYLLENPPDMLV